MTGKIRSRWIVLLAMVAPCWAAERPNVVIILADDLGYECIGANGSTSYKTPHLDRLAATGVRFEHCYAQPLCTPTRVQLMTGQYNVRNYVRFGLLDPAQTTFAHLLKQAGYATCIAGKWQLSNGLDGPGKFGFDDYCLWQLTRRPSRYANPGLEINGREQDYKQGEYGPDLVNAHALDFIGKNKDRPFLLYYPMMLTHGPFQPPPGSKAFDPAAKGENAGADNKYFGDMVAYMDLLIGKLVARLDELGLRERTLLVFTGDNGTGKGINSRLGELIVKGGKGTMTDTGTRVPLIVNWPGATPQGKVLPDLVDSVDFLPTLCAAAGVEPPSSLPLDGHSFLPQVRGEKGQPREWLYCWYAPNQGKVDVPRQFARTHKYKLYGDGSFCQVDSQRFEETRLDASTLSDEATATRQRLQAVLDKFRNARPKELSGG